MRTGKHSRTWWALAALLWLAPGLRARADVVDRPPADCPAGSVGDTCHGGPFCRLVTCTTDSECIGGATCQDTMACIGGIGCGGGTGGGDPPIATLEGPCKDGACEADAMCQAIKICIMPIDPTTGGGGSSSGGSPTSGGTPTSGGSPTSGTASTGGGTASSTGDGTGGGSKGGCTGCATDGDASGPALVLLAIAGLVRRRRRAR